MRDVRFQVLDARVKAGVLRQDTIVRGLHVQLYGVTADGRSVCAFAMNYYPVVFLRVHAESRVADMEDWISRTFDNRSRARRVRAVSRTPMVGFAGGAQARYFELTLPSTNAVYDWRRVLAVGAVIDGVTRGKEYLELHESRFDQTLRQFHRNGTVPSGWVQLASAEDLCGQTSRCDLELRCQWADVQPYDCDALAPFTILSYDIEAYCRESFSPHKGFVMQIGSTWTKWGSGVLHHRVDVLGPCAPLDDGTVVVCYRTEKELLLGWQRWLVNVCKPDVKCAYNQVSFCARAPVPASDFYHERHRCPAAVLTLSPDAVGLRRPLPLEARHHARYLRGVRVHRQAEVRDLRPQGAQGWLDAEGRSATVLCRYPRRRRY